jgi:hypothetical protein
MSFSWVKSAENEVIRLKNSIIDQEKRLEATREKLKLAEQVLADRRERFKDKKDYDGEPYVK